MANSETTKKMDLNQATIFAGKTYGPGKGVEVPKGMRDDVNERAAARRKAPASSPPGASGSGIEGTTDAVSASGRLAPNAGADAGKTAEELDAMSKEDLMELADAKGLDVKGTGANGNILKDDLVKALSAPPTES